MPNAIRIIFDWSEVWALIIPLFQLFLRPKQPAWLQPVIIYLFAALLLNLSVDIIAEYNQYHRGPDSLSNNPLYNIHSVIRFACFSYFFIRLRQSFYKKIKKIIPLVFIVFLIVDFRFEDFFFRDHLSGNLFSAEAFLLLVYCMLFYLSKLKDEQGTLSGSKDFWVVTGLSIYVVTSFFVFLFYVPMIKENYHLANNMWDVNNAAYIILCIFITKAFYVPASN